MGCVKEMVYANVITVLMVETVLLVLKITLISPIAIVRIYFNTRRVFSIEHMQIAQDNKIAAVMVYVERMDCANAMPDLTNPRVTPVLLGSSIILYAQVSCLMAL